MKPKEEIKKKDVILVVDKKQKSLYKKLGTVVHVGTPAEKKVGVEFPFKVTPKQKIAFKSTKPDNCALLDLK